MAHLGGFEARGRAFLLRSEKFFLHVTRVRGGHQLLADSKDTSMDEEYRSAKPEGVTLHGDPFSIWFLGLVLKFLSRHWEIIGNLIGGSRRSVFTAFCWITGIIFAGIQINLGCGVNEFLGNNVNGKEFYPISYQFYYFDILNFKGK